ncbi:MAG: hypothetical protein HYS44_03115 [Candidatus Niyogibacteria bacterium]|nr:hypothetical protein [Candidatus Niyogibacteria bacterium]
MHSIIGHHWKCWLWKLLWLAGVVSLVLAWIAMKQGPVFKVEALAWFWNALVFGVLALPIKMDCSCSGCSAQ